MEKSGVKPSQNSTELLICMHAEKLLYVYVYGVLIVNISSSGSLLFPLVLLCVEAVFCEVLMGFLMKCFDADKKTFNMP